MTVVKIDCRHIVDWGTFHSVFAAAFGFPEFYGRNMDAWIDCMRYIDNPDAGMTTVHAPLGEVLVVHLEHVKDFAKRCPDQYAEIIECAGLVNGERVTKGRGALLALSFGM